MVSKRRNSLNADSAARNRQTRTPRISPKKYAKRAPLKATSTRTRTSLVGMTIYQPDLKPSPVGRKLLEALER
jgi:hypothetical protein